MMEGISAVPEDNVKRQLDENGREAVYALATSAERVDKRFIEVEDAIMKSLGMTSQIAEQVAMLDQAVKSMQQQQQQQQQERMTSLGTPQAPQNNDLTNLVSQLLANKEG